jgi:hypothetical protein
LLEALLTGIGNQQQVCSHFTYSMQQETTKLETAIALSSIGGEGNWQLLGFLRHRNGLSDCYKRKSTWLYNKHIPQTALAA